MSRCHSKIKKQLNSTISPRNKGISLINLIRRIVVRIGLVSQNLGFGLEREHGHIDIG